MVACRQKSIRKRHQGGVSLHCGEFLTVEAQEVARWCMRREEVAHPFFIAPHGTADVEHYSGFLPRFLILVYLLLLHSQIGTFFPTSSVYLLQKRVLRKRKCSDYLRG